MATTNEGVLVGHIVVGVVYIVAAFFFGLYELIDRGVTTPVVNPAAWYIVQGFGTVSANYLLWIATGVFGLFYFVSGWPLADEVRKEINDNQRPLRWIAWFFVFPVYFWVVIGAVFDQNPGTNAPVTIVALGFFASALAFFYSQNESAQSNTDQSGDTHWFGQQKAVEGILASTLVHLLIWLAVVFYANNEFLTWSCVAEGWQITIPLIFGIEFFVFHVFHFLMTNFTMGLNWDHFVREWIYIALEFVIIVTLHLTVFFMPKAAFGLAAC